MPDNIALGDLLSGAAGRPVNRPALDAAVMQGQALAGLRTAQTEEALMQASRLREEQDASDQLENVLLGSKDAAGNNMFTPSQARFTATQMKFLHGGSKEALDAWKTAQEINARATLGDVAQLGQPSQTAAQQQIKGEVATPFEVKPEYGTLPGAAQPNVQQTPTGQAQANEHQAGANLKQAEADHPELFHPGFGAGQTNDPQYQQMLGELIKRGVYDPQHISRYNTNPAAVKAAYDAMLSSDGFTGTAHATIQSSERDFTGNSSQSSGGKLTRGIAVANHVQALRDAGQALQNGDVRLWNYAMNELKMQAGSPNANNLQLAAQLVGRELTAFLAAAGGTREEGQAIEQRFSMASSPEQITGAADTADEFMGGQFDALRAKYRARPDAPTNFEQRFLTTPESQRIMQHFDAKRAARNPGTPPAAPGAAPPPAAGGGGGLPPAALAALKEGHVTTFSNGQKWTLQNGQPVQVQ